MGRNVKPQLVIITGPTASGKTALSLKLAKKFHGEIISADSRQIYRGMDIGTAKVRLTPSLKLREGGGELYSQKIRHHLINIRNPNQNYTLAQYKRDAAKTIRQIQKRGKIPFLVGGTALYIWAILENPEIPEVKPNARLRKQLEKNLKSRGVGYLYQKLIRKDPEAAYIIDPKNPRRIIRALEIMQATGKPFSDTRKKGQPLFDYLLLGAKQPKTKLKNSISKRTRKMIKAGLVGEVKNLIKKYGSKGQAFDAIGYREIIDYLNGKITLDEARELIISNTWHFSGRQMTWFKKLPIIWINNKKQAEKLIKDFLNP